MNFMLLKKYMWPSLIDTDQDLDDDNDDENINVTADAIVQNTELDPVEIWILWIWPTPYVVSVRKLHILWKRDFRI